MSSFNISENGKNIYPEVFFRKFVKNFERETMSWSVNLEAVVSGVKIPITDGIIKVSYFQGEESHLFLINLYNSNKSSLNMEKEA